MSTDDHETLRDVVRRHPEQHGEHVGERAADVGKTLPQATFARMFRFCSAYGIGGLMNKTLLAKGRAYNEQTYGVPQIAKPPPGVHVAAIAPGDKPRLQRRLSSDGVDLAPREKHGEK